MTTKLRHTNQKVLRDFSIEDALKSTMSRNGTPEHMAVAIFNVLTESQQLRILAKFGWEVVPGTAQTVVAP